MVTMNISLPDDMKAFIDEQVKERGFMSTSEYLRDMIRERKELSEFDAKLRRGAEAPLPATSDAEFFDGLRTKAKRTS